MQKKLIVKTLSNIAGHAGDQAETIIPELLDRVRLMLLDQWQSNPDLKERYKHFLDSESVPDPTPDRLPLDHLFFDLDEITTESILQYRDNSAKGNLKMKLYHYLLKLAQKMRPGTVWS